MVGANDLIYIMKLFALRNILVLLSSFGPVLAQISINISAGTMKSQLFSKAIESGFIIESRFDALIKVFLS